MRPGETEAGSAGTQPCRGITRWKLIEEDERGTASTAVLPFFLDFDRFPHALKIPAAKRRNTSYRKTATLHFTLNQDIFACHVSAGSFLRTNTSLRPAIFSRRAPS